MIAPRSDDHGHSRVFGDISRYYSLVYLFVPIVTFDDYLGLQLLWRYSFDVIRCSEANWFRLNSAPEFFDLMNLPTLRNVP